MRAHLKLSPSTFIANFHRLVDNFSRYDFAGCGKFFHICRNLSSNRAPRSRFLATIPARLMLSIRAVRLSWAARMKEAMMSISSVGASSSGYASQMLASLLSKLSSAQSVSSQTSFSCSQAGGASAPCETSATAQNALTGTGKAAISSEILQVLMQMQQDTQQAGETGQTNGPSPTASANAAQPGSSTGSSDPLQQLFSAMDADGNSTISQTEMESYIEGQGGTANQADQLFTALDSSGSGAISQDQLAQTAPPPPGDGAQAAQAHGAHHHHHHHKAQGAAQNGNDMASQFISMLDSNGDGSVDASELGSFVTDNGGTSDQANAIFSKLDGDGSGAVSQSEFLTAYNALNQNQAQNPGQSAQGYAAYNQAQANSATQVAQAA